MLEAAIAESMRGQIAGRPANREGDRGPEISGFLVPQIERFSARIGDRVVAPGCEPIFVRIDAPGVARAALRQDGAHMSIGDDIDPGCGCRSLSFRQY